MRRRNKRLGFGFVNCSLALALVVATLVVTQTSALQYLKGMLAEPPLAPEGGKKMAAAMAIPGNARVGDMRPLVTLKNAVRGRKNGQLLMKTGYVTYFNYERNNPDHHCRRCQQ